MWAFGRSVVCFVPFSSLCDTAIVYSSPVSFHHELQQILEALPCATTTTDAAVAVTVVVIGGGGGIGI